jgi:UDP-N-acetylglucosamine 3-dehydrogenase
MKYSEKRFKCGIIGLGNMGSHHLRIFGYMPDVKIVGISDTDKTKNFPYDFYSNYKDMIKQESPDFVSICVPTFLHYEIAKYCLNNNLHVLLEKPIATSIKEAKDLLSIAEKKNLIFLIGHTERFNNGVIKVKELIEHGDLGNIISIISRRLGPRPPTVRKVGVSVDAAIHDIDIISYLLDDIPIKTTSIKRSIIDNKFDDSAEFLIKYQYVSAFIQVNWITPMKIRELIITGEKGMLKLDYITQKIDFISTVRSEISQINYVEPLEKELRYFVDHVKDHKFIDSSFALEALKTALK